MSKPDLAGDRKKFGQGDAIRLAEQLYDLFRCAPVPAMINGVGGKVAVFNTERMIAIAAEWVLAAYQAGLKEAAPPRVILKRIKDIIERQRPCEIGNGCNYDNCCKVHRLAGDVQMAITALEKELTGEALVAPPTISIGHGAPPGIGLAPGSTPITVESLPPDMSPEEMRGIPKD